MQQTVVTARSTIGEVFFSTNSTFRPRMAQSRAVPAPVIPPPMMMTSYSGLRFLFSYLLVFSVVNYRSLHWGYKRTVANVNESVLCVSIYQTWCFDNNLSFRFVFHFATKIGRISIRSNYFNAFLHHYRAVKTVCVQNGRIGEERRFRRQEELLKPGRPEELLKTGRTEGQKSGSPVKCLAIEAGCGRPHNKLT